MESDKKISSETFFKKYFENIGKPFDEIMKSLKITPSPKIANYYKVNSLKSVSKIKLYPNVIKTLKYLKKKLNFLLLHLKIKLELNFY